MKKITLLLVLLISSLGYSQQVVLENFEGNAPTTELFDGFTSAAVADNPTNLSEKSLKLVTSATGKGWQGAKLVLQNTSIDMTTTDKTMTVDIYSSSSQAFLVKLVDGEIGGADNTQESKTAVQHGGSGWETLTLDFNIGADTGQPGYNPPNDKFGGIVFFPLYIAPNNGWVTAAETTTYVDNISGIAVAPSETCSDGIMNQDETGIDCGGTCDACPSPPTTAPTAPPTRNAGDVISFYSEAYTSTGLNGVTWDNGADAVEENIASNNLLKITNGTGDFIGNEVANTDGFVNATDMTHLHADFWIGGDYVAGQVLKVKLSNHTGGSGETNSITKEIATLSTDAQNWVSIDMELGDDARERIAQVLLIYTNSGVAPSTVYTDNIYMYRAAATAGVSDNAALDVSMHPNPAAGVLNLSAANTIEDAIIYNVLGREVMGLNIDSNSAAIDVSGLSSGIYLIKYTIGDAVGTAKFIKE